MPILTHTLLPGGLAERQEPHVITQTVTQEFTTYTTLITLGTIPTGDTEGEGRPANTAVASSGGGGGISSAELGAILGGVAAVVLIFLIACFCCGGRTKQVRVYAHSSYDESSVSSDPPAPRMPPVRRPPPVVERIPGGPKYPTYRAIPIPNPRNPRVRHNP